MALMIYTLDLVRIDELGPITTTVLIYFRHLNDPRSGWPTQARSRMRVFDVSSYERNSDCAEPKQERNSQPSHLSSPVSAVLAAPSCHEIHGRISADAPPLKH